MGIVKPTFEVIHDTRRQKSDGTYPLKLRVTFDRKRKYYNVGIDLTEADFEKIKSSRRLDDRLKDVKVKMRSFEVKADEVYKNMDDFSFKEFEQHYFSDPEETKSYTVYQLMDKYIQELRQQGRVSTSDSYQSTLNSLKSFRKKLNFEDITPAFLTSYEKHMLDKKKSSTTVGIYLRSLRTIYNQAIEFGIISKDSYPFKKGKFSIPAGRNVKKALTLEEVGKIFDYSTTPGTSEEKAKDFWIFSYLCNGLNIKDICRIKYKDISGDRLTVIRAKTQLTTKSNQKPIQIFLTDRAKDIIAKWGTQPAKPESYVFDILPEKVTPQRERELVQYFTKLINTYMKRIGKELKISKPITTYTARHSFSTVLKRSGAPIEFISESLGHNNLSTTEAYLDSFEDDVKKHYSNLLTNFDGHKNL